MFDRKLFTGCILAVLLAIVFLAQTDKVQSSEDAITDYIKVEIVPIVENENRIEFTVPGFEAYEQRRNGGIIFSLPDEEILIEESEIVPSIIEADSVGTFPITKEDSN